MIETSNTEIDRDVPEPFLRWAGGKRWFRVFYRNNESLEYNKHFFVPHNIVGGYSSLVTSTPNKIIQQALTDCKLLVANYSEITKLYNLFPDFERLGRRLAELYFVNKKQREIEIVLLNADERYLIFRKEYAQLEEACVGFIILRLPSG